MGRGDRLQLIHTLSPLPFLTVIAGILVDAFGLYLVGLAALALIRPALVRRFLDAFARSARAHYTEQATRLLVGAAVVLFAPSMWFPNLFAIFGWVVVGTTVGMLLIPWQWHHRFAEWAIPFAVRRLWLLGLGAAVVGCLILYGASRPLPF